MVRKIVAYFSLLEDGTDAIEKLERGYHLALNQGARQYRRRCPPSCAYRHLPEPGFEGKTTTVTGGSAGPAAHHLLHNVSSIGEPLACWLASSSVWFTLRARRFGIGCWRYGYFGTISKAYGIGETNLGDKELDDVSKCQL